MRKRRTENVSLLPGGQSHIPYHQQAAPPHKAGRALQLDSFTLIVGRVMLWLGVIGTGIEVITSTIAIMLMFVSNPGPHSLGWGWDLALSLFLALIVETGQMTLVINLQDSWMNLLSGHIEQAFVSNGETNRHTVMLWIFEFGGAGINVWWNMVFFGNITTSALLMTLGTAGLLACSLVMWPLGMKIVRNAKRRIHAAQRLAKQMVAQAEQDRLRNARNVIVDATPGRGLLPSLPQQSPPTTAYDR